MPQFAIHNKHSAQLAELEDLAEFGAADQQLQLRQNMMGTLTKNHKDKQKLQSCYTNNLSLHLLAHLKAGRYRGAKVRSRP